LKSRPRVVLSIVIPAAAAIFLLVLFLYQRDYPPTATMANAKAALERAAIVGAPRYAADSYGLADQALRDGSMAIAYQNGRFALLRNYRDADSLVGRGLRLALKAGVEAEGRAHSLDSLARSQHDELEQELSLCREALDGTLINFEAERYWSMADLGVNTAWLLIGKGEYEDAMASVAKAKRALKHVIESMAEAVNNEKGKIATWRDWVQNTLAESRTAGGYALIVDKSAHKAYLVNGGKLVRSYPCELGWNSAEQKYFQGDGATPEGRYKITTVKRASKYYRALMLDYPNDLDRRRFAENKRKGVISRYARIGALIEIHGGGGRDQDWTDGCIAFANRDLDSVMKCVSVGTPVTIVRRSDTWP
jgi:hypothetical protein